MNNETQKGHWTGIVAAAIVAAAVLGGAFIIRPGKAVQAAPHWEYRAIDRPILGAWSPEMGAVNAASLARDLGLLGGQGWELVEALPVAPTGQQKDVVRFVFKRPSIGQNTIAKVDQIESDIDAASKAEDAAFQDYVAKISAK